MTRTQKWIVEREFWRECMVLRPLCLEFKEASIYRWDEEVSVVITVVIVFLVRFYLCEANSMSTPSSITCLKRALPYKQGEEWRCRR